MGNGWISIHRRLEDNEIWTCEKFSKGQAWIDILLIASFRDSSFFVRGNEIKVKRGQFAWSEQALSKRWRWSRNKVRLYLKMLEKRKQIEQQKNKTLSIYTVLNYELYQRNDTTEGTTEGQQKVQQKDIYNNSNNVNNVNKGAVLKKPYNALEEFNKQLEKDLAEEANRKKHEKLPIDTP